MAEKFIALPFPFSSKREMQSSHKIVLRTCQVVILFPKPVVFQAFPLLLLWERGKLLDCRHVYIIKEEIVQGRKQIATLKCISSFSEPTPSKHKVINLHFRSSIQLTQADQQPVFICCMCIHYFSVMLFIINTGKIYKLFSVTRKVLKRTVTNLQYIVLRCMCNKRKSASNSSFQQGVQLGHSLRTKSTFCDWFPCKMT